jgi:hypothetical protein
LSEDRLLLDGVHGGGDEAATTISASILAQAESSSSNSRLSGGVPGTTDSLVGSWCVGFDGLRADSGKTVSIALLLQDLDVELPLDFGMGAL